MIKHALALLFLAVLPVQGCTSEAASQANVCSQPGVWLSHDDAGGVRQIDPVALIKQLATNQVVLLGETHDSAEDHRWQLHTLAKLHALKPRLAIGFEMFPRRLQPVLDRWVAGELSEAEFLRETDWDRVWGYDAQLYLPLFHFARMHRLPMLALNVERSLIAAVNAHGWDGVKAAQREGVSRPAAPPEAYREMLRQVLGHHPESAEDEASFERFVQAQTTWDRAMAEAIAAYLERHPDALVVGIMGAGHVRFGHGVAHQLADLKVRRVATLMTWDAQRRCEDYQAGMADAVYVVRAPRSDPPKLGIAMEVAAGGVRITEVEAASVAEQAGLKAGDVVIEAAGVAIRSPERMRQIVARQAPGTWLPLKVRRDGRALELVARFPPAP